MTSSRRIQLTRRAQRDYREILRYTLAAWGQRQRDVYQAKIDDALQQLASYPNLGRARDEIAPGLRSLLVAEQIIYYLFDNDKVTIVRIAHTKLDPAELEY